MDAVCSELGKAAIMQMMKYTVIGGPQTVREKLLRFISETQVNELMVSSHIFDHAAQIHSYEILIKLWREA